MSTSSSNLVRGDGDSAEQHRGFYDEYLAVMDLTAEFYLQTIDRVFQRRLMANRRLPLPRHADRARGDRRHRADDHRRREGRHHRPRPDRGGARPGAEPARRRPAALRRQRGRALRRLQRLALAQHDPAAGRATSSAPSAARSDRPLAEAIRIGDPAIEVRLRRNARARRMVLRVTRAGRGPTLTLPPGVPLAQARAFLSDQEGWLRRHLAAGPPRLAVRRRRGPPLRRRHAHRAGRAGRAHAAREPDAACCRGRRRRSGRASRASFARRRGRAASPRPSGTRPALGARVGRISLRDPRGRWGSCNATGDLMYSWRLTLAPDGGARLRGRARGGASRRDEPLAALLGGGAAALPRLRHPARLAAPARGGAARLGFRHGVTRAARLPSAAAEFGVGITPARERCGGWWPRARAQAGVST